MNENSNRPTDVGRLLTGCDTKDLVKIRETELEELLALLHGLETIEQERKSAEDAGNQKRYESLSSAAERALERYQNKVDNIYSIPNQQAVGLLLQLRTDESAILELRKLSEIEDRPINLTLSSIINEGIASTMRTAVNNASERAGKPPYHKESGIRDYSAEMRCLESESTELPSVKEEDIRSALSIMPDHSNRIP